VREAERLPGPPQKGEAAFPLAIVCELEVDREIKGSAEDEKVVTRGVALQVARANNIYCVANGYQEAL
jgi:hypothetical protein